MNHQMNNEQSSCSKELNPIKNVTEELVDECNDSDKNNGVVNDSFDDNDDSDSSKDELKKCNIDKESELRTNVATDSKCCTSSCNLSSDITLDPESSPSLNNQIKSDKNSDTITNISILSPISLPSLLPLSTFSLTNKTKSYAVEVSKLCFNHGPAKILNSIDIKVPLGSIYCLIGPSGCGKTTLLRCVVQCLKQHSGTIKVFNRTPGSSHSQIPGPDVGYMPQESALYYDMTVCEILYYFGKLNSRPTKEIHERINFLLSFLDMSEFRNRFVGTLSGGQTRRLSFAAALIHSPPLLILDEPTAGVDPLLRQSMWQHLKTLTHQESITVIITTHYVEEARSADIVALMRNGSLLAEESPKHLIQRCNVKTLEDAFLKLCIDKEDDHYHHYDNPDFITDPTEVTTAVPQSSSSVNNDNSYHCHHHDCVNYNHNTINDINGNSSHTSLDFSSLENRRLKRNSIIRFWEVTYAVFFKNWIRNRRHYELILFQFFMPVVVVILFCYCIGSLPFNIPLAIVNDECPFIVQETSESTSTQLLISECNSDIYLSQRFLDVIDPYLIHQYDYASLEEAKDAVKSGNVWAVIHIPHNFSSAIENRFILRPDDEVNEAFEIETVFQSTIRIYADMTKKIVAITMQRALFNAFQQFMRDSLARDGYNPNLAKIPIELGEAVYGNDDQHKGYTEFMAPGILINFSFVMSAGLTALIFLLDRKDGMMERHVVCGVRVTQLIIAHIMIRMTTMIIQNAIVLIIVLIWLDLPARGPMIWIFMLLLLQSCAGLSFGLLVASLFYTEGAAAFSISFIVLVNLTLCGHIWPIEAIPLWFRWISTILPSTLPTETLRGLLNKGWDIDHYHVQLGFISTIAWFWIFTIAAAKLFKFLKK